MNNEILLNELNNSFSKIVNSFESSFLNSELKEEFVAASQGGKYARALKFLNSLKSELELNSNEFLIANAIEIFQTSALIHDDIIDQDSVRRNRPATHTVIGKEKAILLGDFALSLADYVFDSAVSKLLELEKINFKQSSALKKSWFRMQSSVLAGQAFDFEISSLTFEHLLENPEVQAKKALRVAELKTASYTTIAPLEFALIINDDIDYESPELDSRIILAKKAGVEFQIQNDIDGLEKDINSQNLSVATVILINQLHNSNQKTLIQEFIKAFKNKETEICYNIFNKFKLDYEEL